MFVEEVEPNVFLPWIGTNEISPALASSWTDEQLADHNLYRALPADTTPPTPYHLPTSVAFVRTGNVVQEVARFELAPDDVARETATDIVHRSYDEALSVALRTWPYAGPDDDIIAAFNAKRAQHLALIAASGASELVLRIWTWPAVEDLYE